MNCYDTSSLWESMNCSNKKSEANTISECLEEMATTIHKSICKGLVSDIKNGSNDVDDELIRKTLHLFIKDESFWEVLFELAKLISVSPNTPFRFTKKDVQILGVLALYYDGEFEVFKDG